MQVPTAAAGHRLPHGIPLKPVKTAHGTVQFRPAYVLFLPAETAFVRLQELHRRTTGKTSGFTTGAPPRLTRKRAKREYARSFYLALAEFMVAGPKTRGALLHGVLAAAAKTRSFDGLEALFLTGMSQAAKSDPTAFAHGAAAWHQFGCPAQLGGMSQAVPVYDTSTGLLQFVGLGGFQSLGSSGGLLASGTPSGGELNLGAIGGSDVADGAETGACMAAWAAGGTLVVGWLGGIVGAAAGGAGGTAVEPGGGTVAGGAGGFVEGFEFGGKAGAALGTVVGYYVCKDKPTTGSGPDGGADGGNDGGPQDAGAAPPQDPNATPAPDAPSDPSDPTDVTDPSNQCTGDPVPTVTPDGGGDGGGDDGGFIAGDWDGADGGSAGQTVVPLGGGNFASKGDDGGWRVDGMPALNDAGGVINPGVFGGGNSDPLDDGSGGHDTTGPLRQNVTPGFGLTDPGDLAAEKNLHESIGTTTLAGSAQTRNVEKG